MGYAVLMVGGPLDGQFMNIDPKWDVIRDQDGAGAYVRSPLSEKVTVFHFKPAADRWTKKRSGDFPRQK